MFYWKILFLLVLLAVVGLGKLEDDLPGKVSSDIIFIVKEEIYIFSI